MWLLQVLVVALGIFDLHCGMRSSSLTRDQTRVSYVSCTGRWILYHWCNLGCPQQSLNKISEHQSSGELSGLAMLHVCTCTHQCRRVMCT